MDDLDDEKILEKQNETNQLIEEEPLIFGAEKTNNEEGSENNFLFSIDQKITDELENEIFGEETQNDEIIKKVNSVKIDDTAWFEVPIEEENEGLAFDTNEIVENIKTQEFRKNKMENSKKGKESKEKSD